MKKGFKILATAAAVALLTPYDIKIDKENKTYKFKSFLLDVSVKQRQSETGKKNIINCEFSGKPTKEDIDTFKTNVTHVADESVKFAKETAEKVKSKFDRKDDDGECCCDCDCGCEAEDAGDFCTEEEEKMF